MKSNTGPVRVAVVGIDGRALRSLEMYFQERSSSYVLSDERLADVCIIDLDATNSKSLFQQHRQSYPDRPTIILSVSYKNISDTFFVRKPLHISSLSRALSEASSFISYVKAANSSQPFYVQDAAPKPLPVKKPEKVVFYRDKSESSSQPNITTVAKAGLDALPSANESGIMYVTKDDMIFNPDSSAFLKEIQYKPVELLQGYVQQAYAEAIRQQRDVRLEGPWRPITIYHELQELGVQKNIRHLYAMSFMRIDPQEVSITVLKKRRVQTALMDSESRGELRMPIEQFLWKLALRTSRGRVPVGSNFYAPVKLSRWPDLSRNAITPHAFKIAALWVKHPMSLLHTADVLKIPLRYVFVFYSAAQAANLIEQDLSVGRTQLLEQQVSLSKHKERNIFNLIIDRFRNI